MAPKRTPLYHQHLAAKAKVIDFHGWEMPVQYQSIVQEHHAVRTNVGLFDVSHMGEFLVEGQEAEALVQFIVTNDVARLREGGALYTLMTDENGGTVDDLLVYKLAADRFLLVVNAGNIDSDFEWVKEHANDFDVSVSDISEKVALLAVQGPNAERVLQPLTDDPLGELKPFSFYVGEVLEKKAIISRTGYTGEDGFELYVQADDAPLLFESLLKSGAVPCGLGARDTLRLEAKLALYGNELSRGVTPYEAGLGMFVKLDKGPFVGRDALYKQKEQGVANKLVGIQMDDRSIPRSGYDVIVEGNVVGRVTSGTMSPTLSVAIGLARIDVQFAQVGQTIEIDIRGRRHPAHVVPTPFYKRNQA
ncbi:glycine cleavage system aminomethyltransferase GcvT [Alicyclobacillus dauci]|uniref:Aminomethyltransferase n=1 Tax=Alicyclobacillus dauci TaxID=1475485 RepID=A0ABY6Z7Y9_9BACL|nr:glycine cleavage system aminomethyltransferase GcvT [Alicyclobacillus dauci]WAH38989.1 glycine cleavage system aminomethyltransferase GcvT [Alicyclobacillus dauci]